MWVGTLEFSARGHETFFALPSYRFTHSFKPPQVQSEICWHSRRAGCVVLCVLFGCHIRRRAWQGYMTCALCYCHSQNVWYICIIFFGFYSPVRGEMVKESFVKTVQSHLLSVSRLGRLLRLHSSKITVWTFTVSQRRSRLGIKFN